jgi:serine/threonine protein kinase/WD40 repeat protein
MQAPDDVLDPVDRMAGEFLERRRRGERPTVEEYVERRPELAEKIRDVLSALVLIENYGAVEEGSGESSGAADEAFPADLREIGDYRIVRRVGRGGMGVVYEAEQASLGRRVALKVLPFHSLLSPDRLKRFQLEARAAARLNHPNIVPIHEVSETNGIHYYTMQFIPGQGLDEVLEEVRRLRGSPPPLRLDPSSPGEDRRTRTRLVAAELLSGSFKASEPASDAGNGTREPPAPSTEPLKSPPCRDDSSSVILPGRTELSSATDPEAGYFRSVALIGIQVADALAHAHGAGIVHRDIKPSNLLLDMKGTVWVTDFGLAKAEGSDAVTHTGDIVGTLRYMGPERFNGWTDPRSDIYGLGATLYELLTLRPAFAAPDRATLVREILQLDPPPPHRLDRRIPRDLETIVLKAMEKEPQKRYGSAEDLAGDLKRFLERRPIVARRSSAGERLGLWLRRNPALASLWAVVASLLVVVTLISSAAALRLSGLTGDLQEKQQATVKALRRAYLEEARARRLGRRVGRRVETLKALSLATQIEPGTDLRNEVIAAMGLFDLNPLYPEWRFADHKTGGFAFDERLENYAWSDAKGGIHFTNVATREEFLLLPGPGTPASNLWLSPDGRKLGAIHGDTFTLWDLEARTSRSLGAGFEEARGEFSRDGRILGAGGHHSGRSVIVDMASGEVVQTLRRDGYLAALRLQPGGRLVATSHATKEVLLWDLETGGLVRTLAVSGRVDGVAWHPDGKHLAAGDEEMQIHFGEIEAWENRRTFQGHRSTVVQLQFSPTGDLLASYSFDKRTILWDPFFGEELLAYDGQAVGFSGDGRLLGFRFADKAEVFAIVRPHGYRRVASSTRSLAAQNDGAQATGFSPDGQMVAFLDEAGVHVAEVSTGAVLASLKLPGRPQAAMFAAVKGLQLITVIDDQIDAWSIAPAPGSDGGERLTLGPPQRLYKLKERKDAYDRLYGAALQRGGTKLVFSHRGHPHLLDLDRPQDHRTFSGHVGLSGSIDVSPDGRWIAGGSWHRATGAAVWEVETRVLVKVFPSHDSAAVGFSPDSAWLVVCDGIDYRFYQAGSWKEGLVLERHRLTEPPGNPYFSRDGSMFLFAPTLTLLRLVDPGDGEELATLESPLDGQTFGLDMSPDGSVVAQGTQRGFINLWDLRVIRRELAAKGLDWDLPPYPEPASAGARITGVGVLLGELEPSKPKD